jgi:flavin-dependent dehydrogenase
MAQISLSECVSEPIMVGNFVCGKIYSNGLMAVGDLASQASMLVGEGIRYAMDFGKRAAETAFDAIKCNDLS